MQRNLQLTAFKLIEDISLCMVIGKVKCMEKWYFIVIYGNGKVKSVQKSDTFPNTFCMEKFSFPTMHKKNTENAESVIFKSPERK